MARMRGIALALATAVSVAAGQGAHAGTQFLTYQGPDAVKQGQGGQMKTVDGVDFWLLGSPPHRFQVLGVLEDERWRSGIYGMIQVANTEHDIAKRAKAAGGDAVILTDSANNDWGVAGSTYGSNGYGSFYAHPYGTRASAYVVVKYLPDGAAPAWATAAPQQHSDGADRYGGHYEGGSTAR